MRTSELSRTLFLLAVLPLVLLLPPGPGCAEEEDVVPPPVSPAAPPPVSPAAPPPVSPAAPPPLPDAQRAMNVLEQAVTGLPVRILRLGVKVRGAVMRVEVDDRATLDEVRLRLERSPYLRERARDPARIVEVGAAQLRDARWQCDFALRFDEAWAGDGVPEQATGISKAFMEQAATRAGLRLSFASRERQTPYPKWGAHVVTQRQHHVAMVGATGVVTRARLNELLEAVAAEGHYRATEVSWKRRDGAGTEGVPADAIVNPEIEVATWFAREKVQKAQPSGATPRPAPTPPLPDALRVVDELERAVDGLPVRVLRVEVGRGGASLRVSAEPEALELLSERLRVNAYFVDRTPDPARILEMRPGAADDGCAVAELTVRLRADWHGDGLPLSASRISLAFLESAVVRARLRWTRSSRVRTHADDVRGTTVVTQLFDVGSSDGKPESLTRERLLALLRTVSSEGHCRVTEVAWSRHEAAGTGDVPDDVISKPSLEIAAWYRSWD